VSSPSLSVEPSCVSRLDRYDSVIGGNRQGGGFRSATGPGYRRGRFAYSCSKGVTRSGEMFSERGGPPYVVFGYWHRAKE
jgi:hypothetical protein